MPYDCNVCEDSKYLALPDRIPWRRIEEKEGKRPAWVGLTRRTAKMPCPVCQGVPVAEEKPRFAPWGFKKDGSPRKRPGRRASE